MRSAIPGGAIGAAALLVLLAGAPAAAAEDAAEGVRALLAAERHPLLPQGGDLGARRPWMLSLYQDGHRPVWFEEGRPRAAAREALDLLAAAGHSGLEPDDYDLRWLRAALQGEGRGSPSTAARDTALSLSLLRFMAHVHMGRVAPRQLGFDYHLDPAEHDFGAVLRQAIKEGGVGALLRRVEPALPQYQRLKRSLAEYSVLAAAPHEPFDAAPPVRPGEPHRHCAALRARLQALGDLHPAAGAAGTDAECVLGPELEEAVRRFQERHGLEVDGVVGKATFGALNVPAAKRVRQLELALERMRWLPHPRAGPFLVVNVPAFTLVAFDSPQQVQPTLVMPVIVGRAARTRTPLFAAEITRVVFGPYWYPPRSILLKEILPAVRRRPGYLAANDMEIVASLGPNARRRPPTAENLARLRAGTLRLRQRPGPKNALGRIKFVLPNDYTVYLHDTPAQGLFARARRDFSHGCIRLGDPLALAELALGSPEWPRQRIEETASTARNVSVALPGPLPVIIFYSTAIIRADGTVTFSRDLYGHDARLERALARR